jgi:Domain of unknown function (DUF4389)
VAYPVHVRIEYVERRSRLSTALRFFLVLPHLVAALAVGVAATAAAAVAWVAILATGRCPAALFRFVAGALRYSIQVGCYWMLATHRFPAFRLAGTGDDPVQLDVDEPARRSRLTTLVRLPLAIPALTVLYFLGLFGAMLSFAAWWTIVVAGRLPFGMFEVMELAHRYQARVAAYLWLLTDAYPWFQQEIDSPPAGWGIHMGVQPTP